MELEIVTCFFMLILMSLSQHFIFHQQQKLPDTAELTIKVSKYRYLYQSPILYNPLNCFIFVGMKNILCYHLICFSPTEIHWLLSLFSLYKICF